ASHYTPVDSARIPMKHLAPWLLAVPSLFVMARGGNHFTPLLPLYGEHAGLVDWQTNFLLGTYVIGLIPGLLVAAALSDVYGRKPITLAGLISSIVQPDHPAKLHLGHHALHGSILRRLSRRNRHVRWYLVDQRALYPTMGSKSHRCSRCPPAITYYDPGFWLWCGRQWRIGPVGTSTNRYPIYCAP